MIKTIPESSTLEENALEDLLSRVRSEIYTLNEIEKIVGFYFKLPEVTRESIEKILSKDKSDNALSIIDSSLEHIDNTDRFIQELKARAQERGLKIKEVFGPLRYLLTGSFEGIGVHDLLDILGSPEVKKRLNRK